MDLNDAMHDGDVPVLNLENEYLSGLDWVLTVVCQEKQVTSIECWLHATTARTERQALYKVYACVVVNHRQSKQNNQVHATYFHSLCTYSMHIVYCPATVPSPEGATVPSLGIVTIVRVAI